MTSARNKIEGPPIERMNDIESLLNVMDISSEKTSKYTKFLDGYHEVVDLDILYSSLALSSLYVKSLLKQGSEEYQPTEQMIIGRVLGRVLIYEPDNTKQINIVKKHIDLPEPITKASDFFADEYSNSSTLTQRLKYTSLFFSGIHKLRQRADFNSVIGSKIIYDSRQFLYDRWTKIYPNDKRI